eukprot:CAMPEP_0171431328 /NCGR_PEP_ID=MMETSP0881-20121228/7184_1 /TAXON_ID=67004 /ORGANISM="Thalassiosira weissflogii, Strain CCMP1336" /LENGTH=763 /DNA_ID=CAMNT_0011951599 /DNA_START=29 /DNA_END=2320 /DNA_ORIENTATION=+
MKFKSSALFILLAALSANGLLVSHPSTWLGPGKAFARPHRSSHELNFRELRQTNFLPVHTRRPLLIHSTNLKSSNYSSDSTSDSATTSRSNYSSRSPISFNSPQPLATSGDWSAYLDESKGLVYYFHRRTGESQWEAPAGIVFPDMKMSTSQKIEMRKKLKTYLEERLNRSAGYYLDGLQEEKREREKRDRESVLIYEEERNSQENFNQKTVSLKEIATSISNSYINRMSNKSVVAEWNEWTARIDEQRGLIYYYNSITKGSSWDAPESFPEFKLSASKKIILEAQNRRYREANGGFDGVFVKETHSANQSDVGSYDAQENETIIDNAVQLWTGEETEISSPSPLARQGDWSAYLDNSSGLVYYYNELTAISSWDPPSDDFTSSILRKTVPGAASDYVGSLSSSAGPSVELGKTVANESNVVEDSLTASAAAFAEKASSLEDLNVQGEVNASEAVENLSTEMQMNDAAEEVTSSDENSLDICDILSGAVPNAAIEEDSVDVQEIAYALMSEPLAQREASVEGNAIGEKEIADAFEGADQVEEKVLVFEESCSQLVREDLTSDEVVDVALDETFLDEVDEKPLPITEIVGDEMDDEAVVEAEIHRNDENFGNDVFDENKVAEGKKIIDGALEDQIPTIPVEDPLAVLTGRTLYDVLQCSPTATRAEIKKSYINLAKKTHPDALLQNGIIDDPDAEQRFTEISQAYEILCDNTSRRRYDRELKAKGLSQTAGNIFGNWVKGMAKSMDEALARAEGNLDGGKKSKN